MVSTSRTLKAIILSLLILIITFLTGCLKNHNKCPSYYPGSVWESNSPHIILYVNEEGVLSEGSDYPDRKAFMEIDGELREIYFCYDALTTSAPIYDREICDKGWFMPPEALLLDTECLYFKNMVLMRIVDDNIYGGEYKYVILKRIQ